MQRSIATRLLLLCALSVPAYAAEFRSVAELAVLYDAPSLKSIKRFVLGPGYPLEVLVRLDNMTKVRDSGGDIGWVENKTLSETRTVIVNAANAEVRANPAPDAQVVFRADKGLLLEVDETLSNGWVKVRHRDGESGYIRTGAVWGL
jgi:SH3-like domain-containing protein